ncbi:hypothetical protein FACS189442_5260 [Spirochaetia bacterium]|nr:hypothetical protein FACS189442_5260 [Spirochaetia bacterium]
MIITTDLYSILRAYANKKNSPYIKIKPFLVFLGKHAARMVQKDPEWVQWMGDIEPQFRNEVNEYAKNGRCVIMTDTAEGSIFMPFFFVEKIQAAYQAIDNRADLPFPNETSLKVTLPRDQVQVIRLDEDFASYFDKSVESFLPIIKMKFPDDMGSIVVLAPMLPRRLLEAAILKVQFFLQTHGNKEHTVHVLTPQLSGNEDYVRDMINRIMINPMECLNDMESYGERSFLFWSYFCAMVKSDVQRQREKLPQDIAVLEAAYVIDICNSLYRYRIQKDRDREAAFQSLELRMEQPPFYYSLEAITKFTDKKGGVLLGKYSDEDLEDYILKKTTESMNNETPGWLIIQGRDDERWYIQKDKYLPLAGSMLIDVRAQVKREITDRWIKLVKEFEHEDAMDSDREFDKLLITAIDSAMPMLANFLRDDKLFLIYSESERSPLQLFENGRLLPVNRLLQIKRRDLLMDAKFSLPFWYSTPILTPIFRFFVTFGKKKPPKPVKHRINFEKKDQNTEQGEPSSDIIKAAREIEAVIVPQGRSLEDHLKVMEDRWGGILQNKGRGHLVQEVNSLVRNNLYHNILSRNNVKISRETLGDAAERIVLATPALSTLRDKNSLKLYMELYMIKLILTGN